MSIVAILMQPGFLFYVFHSSLNALSESTITMSKVLGIDHGSVRLGIAVSDPSASVAFGREVLKNDKNVFAKLKSFITEEGIEKIVIGYPLNLKGDKTQQTIEVEKFTEKFKAALSEPHYSTIEFVLWDERFTSKLAADSMLESGMKKKQRQVKGNIDIISAAIMLQSFLDSSKNIGSNTGSSLKF